MLSFLLCLAILIAGYFTYGKFVTKTFGPDDRETPAVAINDGVDYVVMPQWKLFLVQLLNIAGLGPIFGALTGGGMGACGLSLDHLWNDLCRRRTRLFFRYAFREKPGCFHLGGDRNLSGRRNEECDEGLFRYPLNHGWNRICGRTCRLAGSLV